jgi:hypothetical protein
MNPARIRPRSSAARIAVPTLDTADTETVRQCARLAVQKVIDAAHDCHRAIDIQSILGARGSILCAQEHTDLAHSLLIQLTRLTEDRD